MDVLVDSFMQLRSEAKLRMTPAEFQEAERKFDDLVRKARARREHAERPRTL